MFPRLVLTIATAISLTGLYALYSVAMRPIVVMAVPAEQIVDQTEYREAQRPAENVRVAAKFIPRRRWPTVTESKYMLRAEQAFVYTDSWYREESTGKHIKFSPFAMVWLSTDKEGKEQAVSIVADSAQLEFASTFDEKNQNPGRVVGAVLNGAVEIAGPDGLAINGHHFIFNESGLSLLTTNPVSFRFQSHRGSATRMSMKLLPADGLPGTDRPHVFGVESIRLIAGPNASDPENPYVKLKVHLPQQEDPRPIYVQCAGDLEYAVATNTAVFTKDVRAWRGKEKAYDWLNCEMLTLQFTPRKTAVVEDDSTAETTENKKKRVEDQYQKIDTNLEFSWLEAIGGQGKGVKIRSDVYKVSANLERLTYSAESRVLAMSSSNPREPVHLRRERSELLAPQVEAQFDDLNQLETLVCQGRGEFTFVDEKTGKPAFAAKWQKQLTKRTDAETNLDLVQLDDKAEFLLPDRKTGLGAERIRVWLVPTENSSNPMLGFPAAGQNKGSSAQAGAPEPKRLLAEGDVALKSPQMRIMGTNELDIKFVTVPAKDSLGPPIEIPYESKPAASKADRSVAAQGSPIIVSAHRIGVQMRREADDQRPASIGEGMFEGKVKITQSRKDGEKPLILEGDRVNLKNESDKHEVVHVHGQPAFIRDRGYEIEGKDIYLDRGENRAWVDGSGLLKLPVPAETKIPGLEGTANRDLRIRWDESMNFDGLDAKFLGRVEAKLGLGTMRCEQMTVQMDERLSFQSDTVNVRPAVNHVHCFEKVEFENSTYIDKKRIDTYRGRVGEFVLNLAKGEFVAQGPGFVQAWQRQQKEDGGFASHDVIQANRPISSEVAVWDYTRAQFEGKLRGSFDGQVTGRTTRRRVIIDDRVEVIHGPVKLPLEQVNPDKLPSHAGTIRCDQLQLVNHLASERNPKEYRELVGLGNAEVEGQVDGERFTASADEISYDGSKGLYTLRAHGKQDARCTGIGRGNTVGKRIAFNPDPKVRSLKVDGATSSQGSR